MSSVGGPDDSHSPGRFLARLAAVRRAAEPGARIAMKAMTGPPQPVDVAAEEEATAEALEDLRTVELPTEELRTAGRGARA